MITVYVDIDTFGVTSRFLLFFSLFSYTAEPAFTAPKGGLAEQSWHFYSNARML
jgi:hypothetical protein